MGPNPATFKQVDTRTDMPVNACVMGLGLAALWLLYFYGANLVKVPWFGWFSFDSSELPIVTIYAMYIPIFVQMMRKEKDLGSIRRYVMPFFRYLLLSIYGRCGFLCSQQIHGWIFNYLCSDYDLRCSL